MSSWDRCGASSYIGVLSRYEIDVLRSFTTGLISLLEHRTQNYAPVALAQGGTALIPTTPSDDERITAILRNELGEDQPDWAHAFGEERCLREVAEAAELMSVTLPASGGVVRLISTSELLAWQRCIRCVLCTIAVVSRDTGEVKGVSSAPTVNWLTQMSENLTEVSAPRSRSARAD